MAKCFEITTLAVLMLFGATAARAAEWGTLTGRFVYDGKAPTPAKTNVSKDTEVCGKHPLFDEDLMVSADGGLANGVIMLRTKLKDDEVSPEYKASADGTVVLDNKNCRFEPHVAMVRTSQTMELKNSDPIGHNSKVDPIINPGINPILAAGGDPIKHKFAAEEGLPVKVGCNIHPWMGAWVVVRKDPYAAISDKDGKFTIKDLPAGKELEFRLWQEKAGYLKNATFTGGKADTKGNFKYKIKPGENNLGDIKISASVFKK